MDSGNNIKVQSTTLPSHSQKLLTPILRGGQTLNDSFRSSIATNPFQDESLLKSIQKQIQSVSPKPMLRPSPLNGDYVRLQHMRVTSELRHTQLEHTAEKMEAELTVLKTQINQQEQCIASITKLVGSVREEQSAQKHSVERVQRRFHGHRMNIDRALQQTQLALQQQSEVLSRQELLVERVEKRSDGVGGVLLESVYILVGMYVLQTPLFKYTVQLVTVHLDTSGRHRTWLPRFLNIFFFMHFVNVCKSMSRRFNFTSQLWSLFARSGQSAWKRLLSLQSRVMDVSPLQHAYTAPLTSQRGTTGSPRHQLGLTTLLEAPLLGTVPKQ